MYSIKILLILNLIH